MSDITEKYTELREELNNKDPLHRYAKLKVELDDKDPIKKYIRIKEELNSIKEVNAQKFEENKKEREEKTLEAMESLFYSLGGEESDVESKPEIIENAEERKEDVVEEPVGDVEEINLREEQPIDIEEREEEEELVSGLEPVIDAISKQESLKDKTEEQTDPISKKIELLEKQIKQLFFDKSNLGGGLDPNKISADLIPTIANTYDLGSSDRPWKDVHLSGATLVIGGTELASSELTVLDNVTAGTVSASKAVIVDSNKDITGFRNVNATSYSIGGTVISSTAAELNILDGVTSTAAELNILDGVTATTSELNLLDLSGHGSISAKFLRGDGSWQTVSSGGGSAHTMQNAGSDLTDRTNLNFDGTYVIATDDSGNDQTDITLHATLQGLSSVTSTATELNILDGVTATTNEMNLLDVSTATNASSSTFLRGDGSWQAVTGGGASLAFRTVSVSGQSDVVADDTADTLTFIASGDTTITTNAGNDSITIDTTVTEIDGGNF